MPDACQQALGEVDPLGQFGNLGPQRGELL
jgi:hypothetical protein